MTNILVFSYSLALFMKASKLPVFAIPTLKTVASSFE